MSSGFDVPDIEQAVISAMMRFPETHTDASVLREEYFAEDRTRVLFREVQAQGKIDLVAFTQHLRDLGELERMGGHVFVTEVYNSASGPSAFGYYVDRLIEAYEERQLLLKAAKIVQAGGGSVLESIEQFSAIPVRRRKERSFAQALDDKADRLQSGDADGEVVQTGISMLDARSPLKRGDMPLIMGERKSGKTILALTIIANVALRGVGVAYFSLEDREPKVIDRLVAGLSRVPMFLDHVNKMTPGQHSKLAETLSTARNLPIHIIDDLYDLPAIQARARGLVARGIGLLVVDYAQLIRCKAATRREEVEKTSRDLRLLAMELNVPLILLCQLNKDGGTRESQTLEMDCTAAWKLEQPDEEEANERIIRIPFQRNGESGLSIPVTFLGSIARIENQAQEMKCTLTL